MPCIISVITTCRRTISGRVNCVAAIKGAHQNILFVVAQLPRYAGFKATCIPIHRGHCAFGTDDESSRYTGSRYARDLTTNHYFLFENYLTHEMPHVLRNTHEFDQERLSAA